MTDLRQIDEERTPWVDSDALLGDRSPHRDTRGEDRCDRGRQIEVDVLAGLVRSIEADIVPRLVRTHPRPTPEPADRPSADDVASLAALVLAPQADEADAFVAGLRQRGMSLETIYLSLLGPTATLLGDYWLEDRRSFSEVTLGLLRLHHLLRVLGPEFRLEGTRAQCGPQALLLPVPGEHHTFGLAMVAEFFRRNGWSVTSGPFASDREMIEAVREEWFAVIGFSISAERHLDRLASGIRQVRRESRNRAIGVMVGGPLIVTHPDLAARLGADASAPDASRAVAVARRLAAAAPTGP